MIQYGVATLIAAVTVVLFFTGEQQPEMAPKEYLERNFGSSNMALHWLVPLLYVLLALTLVAWVGMRLANPSRRGRALFVFTVGIALIVAAIAFLMLRSVGSTDLVGVGSAAALLLCAMAIVAAGALLPAVEDWIGARRELRLIGPLRREMDRRYPDIGIGVRPRGPLVFRVAEQLSLISDSLYLEADLTKRKPSGPREAGQKGPDGVSGADQAAAVAQWIHTGRGRVSDRFPGPSWLRQPTNYSDREWILEIARQYRNLDRNVPLSNTGEVAEPFGDPGE
jgi:4-amino-4-deoxy-L-arabinose transferase-like glycosyltransferase